MDFRDICTGVGVRRKIHFRETEGNLGCIGGIVNLSAREGGDQGEIKVYVRWAVTRRFLINKKRGMYGEMGDIK